MRKTASLIATAMALGNSVGIDIPGFKLPIDPDGPYMPTEHDKARLAKAESKRRRRAEKRAELSRTSEGNDA